MTGNTAQAPISATVPANGAPYTTLPEGATWDPKQGTHGAVVLHGKVIVVTGINTKEDFDREKAKLVLKRGQHEPLNKKISHFVKDAKAAIY